MDVGAEPDAAPRRRNQIACEACRTTKMRCQPSDQPGVCRKCLDSKRECVLRAGPRVRRPRRPKTEQAGTQSAGEAAGPSGPVPPSSTFSIDFAVPEPQDMDEGFDMLRQTHEHAMEKILPPVEEPYSPDFGSSPSVPSFSTPSSSTTQSKPVESLHRKPQFNLASAESLLSAFRLMLLHFPCISLPDDATVPRLAATSPFALLGILATTSGSKTIQGHSLYDEEFRKVLGLKLVAGGETSLDLLQGILIYCAWYPFHLRPKSKKVFQYIRMASDLVHDLELDTSLLDDPSPGSGSGITDRQLDGIRAYLSHCYLSAAFMLGWRRYKKLETEVTPWTMTCCETLERHAQGEGDLALVALVRQASISSQASSAFHDFRDEPEQQDRLLLDLETQARHLQLQTPHRVATLAPVRMGSLFLEIYINGGSIFSLSDTATSPIPATDTRVAACAPLLGLFFSELSSLDTSVYSLFSAPEWGRLVLAIVMAVRLSLPGTASSLDHRQARADIHLADFLEHMCRESHSSAPPPGAMDTLSASRVVMRIVGDKFEHRVRAADAKDQSQASGPGCPMLDGSLDDFLPIWDADPSTMATAAAAGTHTTSGQPVFHDLWATMTMGWAQRLDEDGHV